MKIEREDPKNVEELEEREGSENIEKEREDLKDIEGLKQRENTEKGRENLRDIKDVIERGSLRNTESLKGQGNPKEIGNEREYIESLKEQPGENNWHDLLFVQEKLEDTEPLT